MAAGTMDVFYLGLGQVINRQIKLMEAATEFDVLVIEKKSFV